MTLVDLLSLLWRTAGENLDVYGAAGMSLGFAASLMPRRELILATAAGAGLCFSVHFLGLGSPTGMDMSLICVTQNLLAARYVTPTTVPRWVEAAFLATSLVVLGVTLATWHGLPSLLAGTGALLSTFARLQLLPQRMRALFMCSTSCWMGHNIIVGSVCGLTCDVLTILGFLVAFARETGMGRRRARGVQVVGQH